MYTGINLTNVSKDYIPSREKHRKQHTAEKLFYKKGTWIQLQKDCNFFKMMHMAYRYIYQFPKQMQTIE